ncbi:MAG: DUF4296 domain-containing protein [Candidatus Delongbacteria bacterium]|jgi:hypothetical protein|nr:DUF4296 domain-containing protein [Candidatus Delongbacteria bacterium]
MKKNITYVILMLWIAIMISGCHNDKAKTEKPDNLIDKDTLTMILVDIHKVDGMLVSRMIETQNFSRVQLYHSVFEKYNVDEDVFNNTVRYYTVNDIETLHKIYDDVLAVLNEEQAKLTQKLQE